MVFSWVVSKKVLINASPKKIWPFYKNVSSWPIWDSSLQWSKLNDKFALGASGSLKPKNWKESDFIITELVEDTSFKTRASLPLTSMVFNHKLISDGEQTVVLHEAQVKGFLAPVLYFVLRKI